MTYKAKIVNFELVYPKTDDANTELFDYILSEITSAAQARYNAIIGLMLIDGFLYKNDDTFYLMLQRINIECNKLGIEKVVLVAGMCEQYQHKLDSMNIPFEIMFFDFNLNMVYQSYKDKLDTLPEWNPTANKFLFLSGVPSRPNRITLLYKFYKAGMLSHANWSFFAPWTTEDKLWCRNELKELTDAEYTEFLEYCNRSVDSLYNDAKDYSRLSRQEIKEKNIHDKTWCTDPSWIDPSIFSNTSFSVISEGNAYAPATDYKFLTEKTWRAILNKHPFILAGEPDQYAYLKARGIRSFTEYFKIPDYHLQQNDRDRFDSIIENTKYFLNDTTNKQIKEDINYNYYLFFTEAIKNQQVLDTIKIRYNVPANEIDTWFSQKSFIHIAKVV
jgi:hypothetical protein